MHSKWNRVRRQLSLTMVIFVILGASACSTMTTTSKVSVDAGDSWAVLSIHNLSETAQADVQAQTFAETQLRKRGVRSVALYSPVQQVSLRSLLDPVSRLDDAMQWARQSGYRYGLTGTVNEWHYKAGADREPAVGVSLKLLDLQTNEVLWQANGARTGWGYANLTAVANTVIGELLDEIQLDNVSR